MSDKIFFDTNIFVYMFSEDEFEKRKKSIHLAETHVCVTSIQALNELSNVFTKKYKLPIAKIKELLNHIDSFCKVESVNRETVNKALSLKERYGFSYYDCLMLSSALENDCAIIFSEDMNNGQQIDNTLKIINPFA